MKNRRSKLIFCEPKRKKSTIITNKKLKISRTSNKKRLFCTKNKLSQIKVFLRPKLLFSKCNEKNAKTNIKNSWINITKQGKITLNVPKSAQMDKLAQKRSKISV